MACFLEDKDEMASSKQNLTIKGHAQTLDTSVPSDFCIKLQEESIFVHKEVLTSMSHYFYCLFDSGMQEAQNESLNLEDLNPMVVKSVVAYMYGDDITVEWDEVTDYLDIVECWQISELKDELEQYVANNIILDNCINGSLLAQRYSMKKVQVKVYDFLCSNFASVATNSDFLSLNLQVLKDLLTNDVILNVSSDDKLQACINWILFKETERKNHYKDLLDHTGLIKCSHKFIQLVVRSYMKTVPDDNAPSVEPYTSMLLAWTNTSVEDKGQKIVIMRDNVGDNRSESLPNKNILQLNFDNATIDEIGPLPDFFVGGYRIRCNTPYGVFSIGKGTICYTFYFGSVMFQDCVTCAFLDIPSMAYLRLSDLPREVCGASAVYVDHKVYVLGGHGATQLMHCLDMQTLQWSHCADIPRILFAPLVCSIGTMIYVGYKSERNDFDFLAYSTTHNVWHHETNLHRGNFQDSIVSLLFNGNYVYIVIGSNYHGRQGICYDTVSKQRTRLTNFSARKISEGSSVVYTDKRLSCLNHIHRIYMFMIP